MKEILVRNTDKPCLIDDQDFELIKPYDWVAHPEGYIYAWINGEMQLMHRFILQVPKNLIVDHINDKRSDNRRSNIRIVNHSTNHINSIEKRTDPKFRNIRPIPTGYQVYFTRRPKSINLGVYKTFELARTARNNWLQNNEPEFFRRPNLWGESCV